MIAEACMCLVTFGFFSLLSFFNDIFKVHGGVQSRT